MCKLLWMDVETGGYNHETDSLLTVGLSVYDNTTGQVLENREFLIKHKEYVATDQALTMNKINLIEHDKVAQDPVSVVNSIKEFIKDHFGEERPTIAGQNIQFDINFVKKLFNGCDEDWNAYASHRTVDTMHILRGLYYLGKLPEDITALDRAITYFKIDVQNRHTGVGDNLAAIEVYNKLKELLK